MHRNGDRKTKKLVRQQLTSDAKLVIVASNPNSGPRTKKYVAPELGRLIAACGWQPEILTDRPQIRDRIMQLQQRRELRYVVGVGGDGTANMLASWLEPETPLAIFPSGTENLLARHFRIRPRLDQFEQIIRQGQFVRCDAGEANGRRFLLHVTVGFDAEVVRKLDLRRKGHITHWSYLFPILKSIQDYPFPPIQVEVTDADTGQFKRVDDCRWAFVFNFPAYALGLPIAAKARFRDGMLDLVTFRGGHLLNGLRYFLAVTMGLHHRLSDTRFERSARLLLTSSGSVPFQLDGDPGGFLPLEIKVLPDSLALLVPPVKDLDTEELSW